MMQQRYGIGLDIGTNSVGFAVTDEDGHVTRVKGKTAIGAHLFETGVSAADRRGFRTTRRRLGRRRWRLRLLREIFDPYITEKDPEFFLRQKYSGSSAKAGELPAEKGLFNDQLDEEFYAKYATMYHLRNALMTEHRQFDVREIYLAIHHIVKSRGHFLLAGRAADFKTGELNLKAHFEAINDYFQVNMPEVDLILPTDEHGLTEIKAVLMANERSQSDRQKEVTTLILAVVNEAGDREQKAIRKKLVTELIKAIVGMKTRLWVLQDGEKDAGLEIKFDGFAEFFDTLGGNLPDDFQSFLAELNDLYGVIALAGIIPEGKTFSQGMMALYKQHSDDLALLKNYCKEQSDVTRAREIRATYDVYIAGKDGKAVPQDDFYKALKKYVDVDAKESDAAKTIADEIATGKFMPKLRTKANGVVPHQVHQSELDAIIENQRAYYPWLAEPNPVEDHRLSLPYKLDELVSFRVPYYVGPMVTSSTGKETPETQFAWMVRKATGTITPWNFDDKVDRSASAEAFIERMKTTDTYLIGEDVLPAQSLLYQKFEVLNELNKIRINGKPVTTKQKQRFFNELFKHKKGVTVKEIQKNLTAHNEHQTEEDVITGLSDPKKFTSTLSSYIDFKNVLGDVVDDPTKRDDIEQIIAWSTLFEDATIFSEKLAGIEWLTAEQQKKLSWIRYRGWGQLSKKLLTELTDIDGNSVIDLMWATNKNFMQIQTDEAIAQKINEANGLAMQGQTSDELIDGFYTSPENKKALREVMKVVADIQRAKHGQAPSWIYIESPREKGRNTGRTVSRGQQLKNLYQDVAKTLIDPKIVQELDEKIKDKATFTDRLVLYFMQNGRDIYTGKQLSIDALSSYDIEHILPQNLIKDDSLDNRVLVHSEINREKNDRFASELFQKSMGNLWQTWQKQGLISQRKLQHLMMRPGDIDKYATGFIARQLTETRQIIKLTADLLNDVYSTDQTQIVMIKAGLNHDFRTTFNFPKLRNVNDYHHAFDALLTAKIGSYLLNRYPKLTPFFVYGEYTPYKDATQKMRSFNFVSQLKSDVVDHETGEIYWSKEAELAELDRVYNFKTMLVTHETTTNHGPMFKQTIYKAKDDQSKKLIPIKKGMPTDVYGGYTKREVSYLSVVKLAKSTIGKEYRVVGIDTLTVDELERVRRDQGDTAADAFLYEAIYKTLNGESKRGIAHDGFKIVIKKLLLGQQIKDNGTKFSFSSAQYYHNLQQLFLSRADQQLLVDHNDGDYDQHLNEIFDHILTQVDRYFSLYDVGNFRNSLLSSRDKFVALPVGGEGFTKLDAINNILVGLHANKKTTDLKALGIKVNLGQLQMKKIYLSKDAQLIYTSPTGLFTRTVPFSSL
ncbi:type II CRISPR RNA-guided endonuclease Cas9 [Furfurilactobacillus entadae]|uniref:type II CRISPR RNA-guided endonuclease Cas9 n=1 Tax=Furfurilactobacillus entadae TaxID=2922307 RepID=UPI0035EC3B59